MRLIINQNGKNMRTFNFIFNSANICLSILVLSLSFAAPALAVDPASNKNDTENQEYKKTYALAQSKNCFACHQLDKKLVGPAYYDIADKYHKDDKALSVLSAKLKAGGSGVWGIIPMPPNQVTEEESKQLLKWILGMKKTG